MIIEDKDQVREILLGQLAALSTSLALVFGSEVVRQFCRKLADDEELWRTFERAIELGTACEARGASARETMAEMGGLLDGEEREKN